MHYETWKAELVKELTFFGVNVPNEEELRYFYGHNLSPDEAYGACCDLNSGFAIARCAAGNRS
jgi:hypothetical protein